MERLKALGKIIFYWVEGYKKCIFFRTFRMKLLKFI